MALILLFPCLGSAQLSSLDTLEKNDRAIGLAFTSMPDPTVDEINESRSAIALIPVQTKYFQGGVGAYWQQIIASGKSSSSLVWRIQGGPHYKWIGLQGYVEGLWNQGIDYAAYVKFGEFDTGKIILAGGLGTLIRANVATTLETSIERNDAAGGDVKVKGLMLVSAEVDTKQIIWLQGFDSLRLLSVVLPGDKFDATAEIQAKYSMGRLDLTCFGKFGWEREKQVRQYSILFSIPF